MSRAASSRSSTARAVGVTAAHLRLVSPTEARVPIKSVHVMTPDPHVTFDMWVRSGSPLADRLLAERALDDRAVTVLGRGGFDRDRLTIANGFGDVVTGDAGEPLGRI